MARIRPSPHGSQPKEKAQVFIPPDRYNFELKVVVTLSSGDIDLMDYDSIPYVTRIETTGRSLMKGFGDATVMITNPMGLFNDKITGGERIIIYSEYGDEGDTPTNVIFEGKVVAPFKMGGISTGFEMELVCQQRPEVQDKQVTETADGTSGYNFAKQIVDNNFSSFLTYTNMSSDMTTLLTRQYVFKYGNQIIPAVFDKCGFTGYIDEDGDIHSWDLIDAETNEKEYIAWGINCRNIPKFGTDFRKKRNSINTVGDKVESQGDLYYMWNKKDSDDIDDYWQKDILLNDNTINSQDMVENETATAYTAYTRTDDTGMMVSESYGLETLRAGQKIRAYVPHCGIDGEFIIHEYTHTIIPAQGSWTTKVNVEKYSVNAIDVWKVRDDRVKGNVLASNNPNGMTGGYALTFGSDTEGTNDNTEIINSTLQLQTGFGTGTYTSALKNVDEDIVAVEVRLRGQDLGNSTVDVTVDAGAYWEENTGISTNSETVVQTTSTNKKKLQYRINLATDSDNADPKVYSATCMFRY